MEVGWLCQIKLIQYDLIRGSLKETPWTPYKQKRASWRLANKHPKRNRERKKHNPYNPYREVFWGLKKNTKKHTQMSQSQEHLTICLAKLKA